MIDLLITACNVVAVVVVALLFSAVIGLGVGMWLKESSRHYQPYEQPKHVRVLGEDEL